MHSAAVFDTRRHLNSAVSPPPSSSSPAPARQQVWPCVSVLAVLVGYSSISGDSQHIDASRSLNRDRHTDRQTHTHTLTHTERDAVIRIADLIRALTQRRLDISLLRCPPRSLITATPPLVHSCPLVLHIQLPCHFNTRNIADFYPYTHTLTGPFFQVNLG